MTEPAKYTTQKALVPNENGVGCKMIDVRIFHCEICGDELDVQAPNDDQDTITQQMLNELCCGKEDE